MMALRALILRGGWVGHEPVQVSELFRIMLQDEGFSVSIIEDPDLLKDPSMLANLDLFVPVLTMTKIDPVAEKNILAAIAAGTGIAGCHGGMCDAFRESTDWQFMTGGQWVAHPGNDGVEYVVQLRNSTSPLVAGMHDFHVRTEHYYLHVDPVVEVLATTRFPLVDGPHAANGPVDMPVVWTKRWGEGRVFYNALGHHADVFEVPEARELMRRGFLWAARAGDKSPRSGF